MYARNAPPLWAGGAQIHCRESSQIVRAMWEPDRPHTHWYKTSLQPQAILEKTDILYDELHRERQLQIATQAALPEPSEIYLIPPIATELLMQPAAPAPPTTPAPLALLETPAQPTRPAAKNGLLPSETRKTPPSAARHTPPPPATRSAAPANLPPPTRLPPPQETITPPVTLQQPFKPPDVPCSFCCCWTHVPLNPAARDSGDETAEDGWIPGWLVLVEWVPERFWSLGCLPSPWEDWLRGYLDASRERKEAVQARADAAELEAYLEATKAAKARKLRAEARIQEVQVPTKPTAAAPPPPAQPSPQQAVPTPSPSAPPTRSNRSKPPPVTTTPPPKQPEPQLLIATWTPQPKFEDDVLRKSPPKKDEIERALKELGYSKKSQVADMVHRVLDHERNVSASSMSAGIADAVANARAAKRAVRPRSGQAALL